MIRPDISKAASRPCRQTVFAVCVLCLFAASHVLAFQYFDSPGTYPHGLATDGTNLWNADYTAAMIYQLNPTGAVLNSFSFTYGNPRGLAYTNGILFVASGTRIYQLNAANGSYISDYASPNTGSPNQQGLALSPGRLWVSDLNSGKIYGINPTNGQTIVSFSAPGGSPRGLAFYNDCLWNLDSSAGLMYRLTTNGSVKASYPIPFANPRGMVFFNGSFVLDDTQVDLIASFDITNTYSSVYIAPSQFPCPGNLLWLPYISSQPLNQTNAAIKRILFYQHGVDDDPVQYFADAHFAAKSAGKANETLIISLQLLGTSDFTSTPPTNLIYWGNSDGRFWGTNSAGPTDTYPRGQSFSSYILLDNLLTQLVTNTALFPSLQQIVISGHSGGGQFANRYAATSTFESTILPQRPGVNISYVVMNPSTSVYFNGLRYDPATLNLNAGVVNFITPASPPSDYNTYGYGLQSLYPYQSSLGSNGIVAQYPGRKVIYLQGTADTLNNDLDVSPEAMLDGTNRYQRSFIYYAHLKNYFGTNALFQHRFATVAGIGHDAYGMITSTNGVRYVFQEPLAVNQLSITGKTVTLHWSGGDGSVNVQYSTNLLNWTNLAALATSPTVDTNTLSTTPAMKFYRLLAAPGP
ncbi:MAG TPA: hypothetical protein VK742_16855 [Candidatus Sulfotelmatobacter sp.]|nr:hypothetical protein [Candidatus Sulfotelmatobacter sp.]